MKVKLNTLTNYEGCTFKLGDEIDIPLNIAMRWIAKGIAHPVKEEVKPFEPIIKTAEDAKEFVRAVKEYKVEKPIEAELIYDGIDKITEISVIPKFHVEVKKDKKSKKKK